MTGNYLDLKALTDGDLDELRRDVLAERERRANLAAIPDQIASLAKLYRDGGGVEQALQDALTAEELAAMNADG